MFKHYRTFYTVLLLILLSMTIVMTMYTHIINTSLTTVQENIQANNLNRLRQLVNHVDNSVDQLSIQAISMEVNPTIKLLSAIDILDNYEQIKLRTEVENMINLHRFSQGWNNQISVYSHLINKWVGTTEITSPPEEENSTLVWTFNPSKERFETYRRNDDFTIRITFQKDNLEQIVNNAKIQNNHPFFVNSNHSVIIDNNSDKDFLQEKVLALSKSLTNREEGTEIITIDRTEYMVNFIRSKTLGWYLVDYLPLDVVLQPINQTRNIFYATCTILLIGSIITLIYLYRKVQVPIITMLKGVQSIRSGDYSYRINKKSNNEFDILYKNFNEMVEEIEELVERVYKEKVISREAMIKKLQAQINPHFLYNCLFFINNMNRLGNDEAVEAMTHNLAAYFRYSTRLDKPMTSLAKEIDVVENYLNIQQLRMERLKFEINIPDSMKSLVIPKLLIQPLVENSVVHGIENKQGAGFIRITGIIEDKLYRIIVEDNGKGMSQEDIQKLYERIHLPLDDKMGCALWNINQRMEIHYGNPAGIEITKSTLGGLCITLFWPNHNLEGGLPYVPIINS
ncbi:sensor histidine kinase [Litchfieldia salsa]|uniref:Two-component system, sensor histidine kinase YesM n=1 Tax=Litchfieldia salsa TaxID=930152 RepID=A0A1H0VM03_9BACI|nr:histidine kinase [Litchfieldia salsa]SDP79393.1 two-component system, sensor histidine kinase YesM [Litchfieldia salsa]